MNPASYKYMSDRRGAQLVPLGMLIICWNTFPMKTAKMLSNFIDVKEPVISDVGIVKFSMEICCFFFNFSNFIFKHLIQVCDCH